MKRREERRRFWSALVARFEGAGMSRREFAAKAGVGLPIFQYWLYKLRREAQGSPAGRAAVDEVRLVPVSVRSRPAAAARVEIHVAGVRLRVPVGADPGYVARVAVALREASAC